METYSGRSCHFIVLVCIRADHFETQGPIPTILNLPMACRRVGRKTNHIEQFNLNYHMINISWLGIVAKTFILFKTASVMLVLFATESLHIGKVIYNQSKCCHTIV